MKQLMQKVLLLISVIIIFATTTSCYGASHLSSSQESASNSNIKYMTWQEDNFLWTISNNNHQLIQWDTQTGDTTIFEDVNGYPFVDSKNNLWVFGNSVIKRFDGEKWDEFTPGDGFIGGQVLSVAEDDTFIWLGTSGLSRYHQQKGTWEILFKTPPGPSPTPSSEKTFTEGLVKGIHAIMPEHQGTIWLGTDIGLTRIENGTQQTWVDGSLSNGVRCLLQTNDEKLWVCIENGVGIWNGDHIVNLKQIHNPFLLADGGQRGIWVASWESDIIRWNGASWDQWEPQEGVVSQRPTVLLVSKIDDNIWVGTKMGISRWNGNYWRIYDTDDGLTSSYINTLLQNPAGVLWAGTQEGVNVYNPETDRWEPFP